MQVAGIVGWPVAHSRSPLIFRHWFEAYGIDGAYVTLPVRPGELAVALRGLAALGMRGCNVTVPHKEDARAIVDRLSARAEKIGAVNVVTVAADGTLDGDNTDAAGFMGSLPATFNAIAGPAVVIGAGGAARAVIWALLDAGAPSVRLVNRTFKRAEALAGDRVEAIGWADRSAALDGAALLVNTTTAGMAGHDALDLDLAALPVSAVVSDIVYVPMETPLLVAAKARGNTVAGGLPMLLHQAVPAFAAWFGVRPAVTPALVALVEATL